MAKYKVIFYYSDGGCEEEAERFSSVDEAERWAEDVCMDNECEEGAEILNMSNPGDYPLEDTGTIRYEVVETDD